MYIRSLRIVLIAGILLAATLPALQEAKAQSPARLRLGTLAPKNSSYHQILLAMAQKWRQAPGGGVQLTVYTDGTMGGEADMVRRMRVGQLQAAMLTVTGLSDIEPSVTALQNMPMRFRTLEEVDHVREKLRATLEKRFLEKGFVVLFWGDAGWVRFFSKTPVLRPDDLKKLKVFTWAGDPKAADIMKAAGFQPVPLEPNDILPALQTGLISATPSIPYISLVGQFYNAASHMLELNWAPLVGGTVITKKVWDTIPAETQKVMLAAAAEAGTGIQMRSRKEGDEAVEAMKKRGLNVHKATPEIEAEWRRLAESVYPQIRGGIVPADMWDEVGRILDEYRRSGGKPR